MELVPWRPFRPLTNLQGEVNRLFEDFFGRTTLREREIAFSPSMDVEETDEEITVTAELPGVDPKEVEVSVSGNNLVIKGERKQEKEEKKKSYHLVECSYGSFYRSIPLPVEVDTSKVNASYKKGLLTISLPKTERVRPKQIKVEIK